MNNGLYASDYRKAAKESLSGRYWSAFGVYLLATIIIGAISLDFATEGELQDIVKKMPFDLDAAKTYVMLMAASLATTFTATLALAAAKIIFTGVTQMGLARYNINICVGEDARLGDLFSCYATKIKKGVIALLLYTLYVSLWALPGTLISCIALAILVSASVGDGIIILTFIGLLIALCVIPVLIVVYRYTFVFHILSEDDTIGARDALKKSKELMKGNKWRLFCLDISYTGWILLGILGCGISVLFVFPYINSARAHFYCELVGKNGAPRMDSDADIIDYGDTAQNAPNFDYLNN
jgi:uncharacterized membrane protein